MSSRAGAVGTSLRRVGGGRWAWGLLAGVMLTAGAASADLPKRLLEGAFRGSLIGEVPGVLKVKVADITLAFAHDGTRILILTKLPESTVPSPDEYTFRVQGKDLLLTNVKRPADTVRLSGVRIDKTSFKAGWHESRSGDRPDPPKDTSLRLDLTRVQE